jgi:hypothetical protein
MTTVNSKEFASNQKRYFDMAVKEQVCIRRGKNMFRLIYAPVDDDYDDDYEDSKEDHAELLALAKSRMADGDYTSLDEYMTFLDTLIAEDEQNSRKTGL